MADWTVTVSTKKDGLVPRRFSAAWWHISLQGGLMLVFFMLAPNVPRIDVLFLFLLGAVSLFHILIVERDFSGVLKWPEEGWLLAALFGLSGYLFLNAFWAEATSIALGKAGFFLLMILIVLLASRSFARQTSEVLERAVKLIVWGFVIGTAFVCFEFSTDHYLERMLYTAWPAIRPSEKTIDVLTEVNGNLVKLAENEYRNYYGNVVIQVATGAKGQNSSLLLLLLWPILFLAAHQKDRRVRLMTILLIGGASTASILLGLSQTAQVALVASIMVFLAARVWPRVVHWSVLGAWCVAVMLAVPLAGAPYKAGLHKAEWLFSSARDRIIIWGYTIEHMDKVPLFGKGIRSTRFISKRLKKNEPRIYEQVAFRRLGLHSHNQFLQVWFELGAFGAVLVLIAGIGILQLMRRLDTALRPYAYAAFVAACLIAAFGWGLWQTWLMAGYAFSGILLSLAAEFTKNRADRIPLAAHDKP